jgi:predicted metal-dependent TIM-barrel fold hydrolase
LDEAECRGIGEIGLETGSSLEKEMLCAQVEFGLSLARPDIRFGIHTPRKNKYAVARQLLDTLAPHEESLAPVSVIDHCSPGIIEEVLSRGYHAGISLSATKSSGRELVEMMALLGRDSHRIMCNTDSSREFFEDVVMASRENAMEKEIAEDVFFGTASKFFGIT